MVIANRKARHSTALADYYMNKRAIPAHNLIKLWVTDSEVVSREDYERDVAVPVRRYLKDKDPFRFIRCLVIMYGLPLRVAQPKLTSEEKARLKKLQTEEAGWQNQIEKAKAEKKEKVKTLEAELAKLRKQIDALRKTDQVSSVDSEIALVLEDDYSLSGWVPNPYFVGYRGKQIKDLPRHVFMVSRQAFPIPEVFFGLLIQGRLTLGECYAAGLPFLSWKMVLIGDPLYSPSRIADQNSKKMPQAQVLPLKAHGARNLVRSIQN